MISITILTLLALFIHMPAGRLCFYFLGALLVLGPEQITIQKVIYFSIVVIIGFASTNNVLRMRHANDRLSIIKSTFGVFKWLSVLTFYLFIISLSQGNSITDTTRGLFPLLLCLTGIPLMIDAGFNVQKERLFRFTIYFGLVSSFFVWFFWTQRRGFLNFGVERLGLDSEWLAFLALIVLVTQKEKVFRFKVFDVVAAGLIIGLLIFTLTRTNIILILFISLFGLLLAESRLKIFGSLVMYVFFFIATLQSNLFGSEFRREFYYRITRSLELFREEGLSSSGVGGEGTFQLRNQQSELALQNWRENFLFGSGTLPKNQIFDSFLATPAQFGIIGLLIFLIFSYRFVRLFFELSGEGSFRKIGYVYFFTLLLSSLIYNWPVNKSVWMSISLLVVISINKAINPGCKTKPKGVEIRERIHSSKMHQIRNKFTYKST